MRIAIIGDLHLVSPEDPTHRWKEHRKHFAEAWQSFDRIDSMVQMESPDLVVFVGDIVDWYSDENRDFALSRIDSMKRRWLVTPGNHDFALAGGSDERNPYRQDKIEIRRRWAASGVAMGNRSVDADGLRLLLVDSPDSSVPMGTSEWLLKETEGSARNILITHVPLDTPEVRNYILTVQPQRDLRKYVQSGAPTFFQEAVRDRVQAVFSGHLHFPGRVQVHNTDMFMLPLSTQAFGKSYPGQGGIFFLDTEKEPSEMVRMAG